MYTNTNLIFLTAYTINWSLTGYVEVRNVLLNLLVGAYFVKLIQPISAIYKKKTSEKVGMNIKTKLSSAVFHVWKRFPIDIIFVATGIQKLQLWKQGMVLYVIIWQMQHAINLSNTVYVRKKPYWRLVQ